jgi:transposase
MQKQKIHTQTAVEWLWNEIDNLIPYQDINKAEKFIELLKEAKEIEKEQIEEAFSIGEMNNDSHHYTGRKIHKDQADYFNKTYAK